MRSHPLQFKDERTTIDNNKYCQNKWVIITNIVVILVWPIAMLILRLLNRRY